MAATNISDTFRSALRTVSSGASSGDSSGASDDLVQKKNLTYEQMLALLQMPTYDARDEETLRQVAQSMYAPQYNAEVEAAQQAQAKTNLSLENQLAALLTNVGAQRDELAQSVLSALSQQQQSALQRGMQRSSYNQAAQSGIQAQGVKLNDQISSNLLQQQSAIEAQRQQGAEQLAQTLSRLLVDRATNENNLMQQLRDQDYERGMAAMDMSNQLYQWLAGTYWPNVKDSAGLPEALLPPVQNTGYTDTPLRDSGYSGPGYWANDGAYFIYGKDPNAASATASKPKSSSAGFNSFMGGMSKDYGNSSSSSSNAGLSRKLGASGRGEAL